jgi:TAP-like protein
LIPGGTVEHHHWFNELERISATPEMAERFLCEVANINVVDQLPKVKAPTLVLHCRDDALVPFSFGQEIAAHIPGAKLVPLEGKNHIILADDPAHRGFFDAVAMFLGDPPFKGALPGSAKFGERLDNAIKNVEQNWFIKLVVIVAAITGVVIFFMEMWKLWFPH